MFKEGSWSMFHPSCALVRTHTGHETSAHAKIWSSHNVPSKNVFAHISYTSFQIQMSSGKVLHRRNLIHYKHFITSIYIAPLQVGLLRGACAHRLYKIRGNISLCLHS